MLEDQTHLSLGLLAWASKWCGSWGEKVQGSDGRWRSAKVCHPYLALPQESFRIHLTLSFFSVYPILK